MAVAGLALLAVSLAGGTPASTTVTPAALVAWLSGSAILAALLGARRTGAGLGLAAGTLYAAGDVATKAAVHGGVWLLIVPIVLVAHGTAFAALQLGFQRGTPLATAGTSTLLTNAFPIAAGVVLFHEHLPGGALGTVRIIAFASVVVAAAMLARQPSATTRSADLDDGAGLAQELGFVRPSGEADVGDGRKLAQALEQGLDVPPLVEHVGGQRKVEALGPRLAPVPDLRVERRARCGLHFPAAARRPPRPVGCRDLGAARGRDERRETEPAAELDDAQSRDTRGSAAASALPPARARPSTAGTRRRANASSSSNASGETGRSSESSTSPTRSVSSRSSVRAERVEPDGDAGRQRRQLLEREQHTRRCTPRARWRRAGSSSSSPGPPSSTSWWAISPGSRTEWIGTSPPSRSAVSFAVPDGASSFVA